MPLTVGTNSYITVANADAYLVYAINAGNWSASDTAIKESALISATRMLDRQPWAGSKTQAAPTQLLQWPRTGLTDRDGNALSDSVVPQEIIDATCELAVELINNPALASQPDTSSNIKRVKADTVEIEYIRAKNGPRFPTIITELIGLWLSSLGSAYSGPFFGGAENETTLSDNFDLTGGL